MRLSGPAGARLRVGALVAMLLLALLALPLTTTSTPDAVGFYGYERSLSKPSAQSSDPPLAPRQSEPATPGLPGYAAAVPAPIGGPGTEFPPARTIAPSVGTAVRLTADHAACGTGFTAIEVLGDDPFGLCTHTRNDPAPTRSPKQGANRVAPICRGNGVNGPRIQLLYVYIEGRANKAAEYVPHIVNSWVPAMEGAFRATSAEQGREIGLRFYMPNCELDVGVVRISEDDGFADEGLFGRIVAAARAAGYTQADRKYHVWYDGAARGPCGQGSVHPVPGTGDNPTPVNANNFGYSATPQFAVSYKSPFPFPGVENSAPICWGNGAMGAVTETHEVLHTLGSVNPSSPNSNGFGHCTDALDIMCYSERGVSTVPRCAVKVESLDCGSDDYFNSRPQLGSYLSTNWNIANSRYLGDAPQDLIPLELPQL